MPHTFPDFDRRLQDLRRQIDSIDERIIAMLIERSGIVAQVGALKHKEQPGICPLRPGREANQLRSVVDAFKGSEFLPAAAAQMWRMMIMSALSVESKMRVSVYHDADEKEIFWLAREYFSPFVPYTHHTTARFVIADIMDGKAEVGVLPWFGETKQENGRWWLDRQVAGQPPYYIFARLPFVYLPSDVHSVKALAIGQIEPEETGDDLSYLALQLNDGISQQRMLETFEKEGFTLRQVDNAANEPGKREHLLEIEGYIRQDNEKLKQVQEALGRGFIGCRFLGAVAMPIELKG